MQIPKCQNVEWYLSGVMFGELIYIILNFTEVGYVTKLLKVQLSLCALLIFTQNLSHKRAKITPCVFFLVFPIRLLLLEKSWERLVVCAVFVLCAE